MAPARLSSVEMTPQRSGDATSTDRPHSLPADRLDALRGDVRGAVLEPDDDGYDDARRIWNGMIDNRPALIVRCTGTADVVATVEFARETDHRVGVLGGGHNVAGTAVPDGGVVVDLSAMTGVRVDHAAGTVRAEGGAELGDVDHETQLFGLATPLGAVSETGIAGLTLNGGYGHLSREHGLAADNLVSADVVTADGAVRTVDADSDPDLFWALRGGGGSFGVVTSFEYQLYEVGPEVYAIFEWYDWDEARAVMGDFREWTANAPRQAGALPFAAHVPELAEFPESSWGEPAVAFLGSCRDDLDPAGVYAPLREGREPIADFSGPMAFADLQSVLDEDYPEGLRYYWKSIYLTDLTDEVFDLVVEYTESAPSKLSTLDVWHLGGAVGDVARDETAFWFREEPYMFTIEANWEEPAEDDANVEWARDCFAAVESLPVAVGRYGNFPGFEEDPPDLRFGGNYDRMVDVKTTYDPENLFGPENGIEPRTD